MGMISRNVTLAEFGKPESVVQMQRLEATLPGAGEICLRTKFAPINPADINVMEGTYGTLPALPAAIGNESAGVVESIGPGVTEFAAGDLVMPVSARGLWQEFLTVPATQCVKLPPGIDLAQAAMLRVNPATAWIMLTNYIGLAPGDWVVQNAANSAVGLSVMQLARTEGWRVLNLVRRAAAAAQCRALGAEHVVCEDDPAWKEQALAILGKNRAQLGLNAVGGESALRVATLLKDEGIHITYGAMSRQKVSVPNRFLIFQNLTFTGFWLSRWMQRAGPEKISSLYAFLAQQVLTGSLHLPIAQTFPVEEITAAVTAAQKSQRAGKILLSWPPGPSFQ
jgi:trans-2-enoyl-CoA reductase